MIDIKKILSFVIIAVCIVLIIVCVTAIKTSSNKRSFQSEAEMSEVLNGTWRTVILTYPYV